MTERVIMEWWNFSRICVPVPKYIHHVVGNGVARFGYWGTLNPLQIDNLAEDEDSEETKLKWE